jgi:hypothetical protein
VVVSEEPLRCPALANVAWSKQLTHFPDVGAFEVSAESAGHLNGYHNKPLIEAPDSSRSPRDG